MKKDRNKNGSGKKSGKGLKIAGAVLIVFIPVQLFVMGWFGGLGPFKGMKDVRMGKHPGNAPEYDFDKISALENSPLAGKQVCILGSSVVYGSASGENAVGEYLSARLGFDLTKEAVSGTTLVDIGEKSYISRRKTGLIRIRILTCLSVSFPQMTLPGSVRLAKSATIPAWKSSILPQ